MKRSHRMPFGAEPSEGATRFRLWAPSASRVDVVLEGDGTSREQPLRRSGEGWYEATIAGVAAGARYAYRIDHGLVVPDPASRSNPGGVHGTSMVVDPHTYEWRDADWRGRPWEEAVIYELHVGTFTREGTFAAVAAHFDHLITLGVTAIELMPVAAFPGQRNWGYDGVLPFAPDASYGSPDDLKRLVDAAHACGLMVLLDVVYNHFGPEGNYLHAYAPQFFNPRHRTPWGAALNFDGTQARTVRDFFIHNALYWLGEFHFDGLRLDAVHAIADDSRPDIVDELVDEVRRRCHRQRHVHLVLENESNESGRLRGQGGERRASAQWNDDFHHALHVLVSGERDGYYADYADDALQRFGRALAEGFVYQGEPSAFRDGAPRGEPSVLLPPTAFVTFAQNHDQVGNRALGERLHSVVEEAPLRVAVACLLLGPAIPMLFMGEEFVASSPFLFFCDFGSELAQAVTHGRREEFRRFERFHDPAARAAIPDPNVETTFTSSKLDWREAANPPGAQWLGFYRRCLDARRTHIVPRLAGIASAGRYAVVQNALLRVEWTVAGGGALTLVASFARDSLPCVPWRFGDVLFESNHGVAASLARGECPAFGVLLALEAPP